MGIILFLLSCIGVTAHDEAILKINSISVTDTFAVGSPTKKANWQDPPHIRVCAASEVSISRINRALSYWEKLGYDFGIVRKDYLSTCMNPRVGEIIITLPEAGFSSSHMASTRITTDNRTGNIVKAKIFILPKNARKERVIEHEIGHALGWSHYRQRYHMMHSSWQFGGFDSFGLRKEK
jgi:hypothetical protein